MASRLTDDVVAAIIDSQSNPMYLAMGPMVRAQLIALAVEVRERREVDKLLVNGRQQNVRWRGSRRK